MRATTSAAANRMGGVWRAESFAIRTPRHDPPNDRKCWLIPGLRRLRKKNLSPAKDSLCGVRYRKFSAARTVLFKSTELFSMTTHLPSGMTGQAPKGSVWNPVEDGREGRQCTEQ